MKREKIKLKYYINRIFRAFLGKGLKYPYGKRSVDRDMLNLKLKKNKKRINYLMEFKRTNPNNLVNLIDYQSGTLINIGGDISSEDPNSNTKKIKDEFQTLNK